MPDTQEMAVVHQSQGPPGGRPPRGPVVLTLVLTLVVGLVGAFVVVVGFWPEPAPPSGAAGTGSSPTPAAARVELPGGRITLGPAEPDDSPDAQAAVAGNWRYQAGDEFADPELDTARWQPYTDGAAGAAGERSVQNLEVSDGVLQVVGRGLTSGGLAWDGGQTYGRWEVRARAGAGAGFRPAVLLWPEAEDWPIGGEIDFMDVPDPERAEASFVVHHGPDNTLDGVTAVGDFTEWHNFAVEWTPDHIAGFIDGREVYRTTDRDRIPTRAMRLTVQQDIGPSPDDWAPAPDASTPPEVRLEIDWVRIYSPE